MIRHTGALNLLCASLVTLLSMSGCGGGGGGGNGNSVAATTSTSLSSSSSTTTTTTTLAGANTTTTTLGGGGDLYTITFALEDAVTIAALQVEVDYSAAGGDFVGAAAAVSCTWAVGGVLASFHDVDASAQLNFAAISSSGFTGPATLASCTFAASGPAPVANDFSITVVEAHGPGLAPIVPLPSLGVSTIVPQ